VTKAILLSAIAICLWASLFAQTASLRNGIPDDQVTRTEPSEEKSNWAFAGSLSLGHGVFTRDLTSKYRSHISLQIGVDVYYKDFTFYGGIYGGLGVTKKDFWYDTTIVSEGALFEVAQPELSIGYIVLENRDFKIAPFAGMAFSYVGPGTIFGNDSKVGNVVFERPTFYTMGLNVDLKGDYLKGTTLEFWSLRLRYAYNFQLKNPNSVNGSMHSLTLGISLLTWPPFTSHLEE